MKQPNMKFSRRSQTNSKNNFSKEMKNFGKKLADFGKKLWRIIKAGWKKFWSGVKDIWHLFLRSFARWVDPKLEPHRDHRREDIAQSVKDSNREKVIVEEQIFTPVEPSVPETRADLFALIREAPMSLLSSQERRAMAAVLELPDTTVSAILTPVKKMVFLSQDETLGPLVLDRLYKSGFIYFPVVDGREHIIGILQTTLLNSLDIRETSTAREIMDPRVFYLREDYTLEQALKAFLRTGTQMMLVVDHYEKLVGMLTFAQLIDFLFSEKYRDDFDRDDDRLAVAKRR